MEVISSAWRTDLALHELRGGHVEHAGNHLVSRAATGTGPGLLLIRRRPLQRDVPLVLDLLRAAFPDDPVVRLGIDDPDGTVDDLGAFADLGFETTAARVLTAPIADLAASAVRHDVRRIVTEADWEARVDLRRSDRHEPIEVARALVAAERSLDETGRAAWFGAFHGPRLAASAGVVVPVDGLARLQDVDAHGDARHDGLEPALVQVACGFARDHLGATTAMVIADPGHPAIARYEALGFTRTETQLRATARAEVLERR